MGSGHFRLKLHQFIFASFNRIGFKLIRTKNIDKIISEGSIIHLCRQGGKRDQQTFVHAFLPEEKLLTISCITPSVDSSGRWTSQNRTLIIRTTDLEEAFRSLLTEPVPINPPKEVPQIEVDVAIE
jgi:hypothetical protein